MCGETPNAHLGFGGPGPHFCLGANLARRELAVVFRDLFARLPDIEVVGAAVPLDVAGLPLVGGIKTATRSVYADPPFGACSSLHPPILRGTVESVGGTEARSRCSCLDAGIGQ